MQRRVRRWVTSLVVAGSAASLLSAGTASAIAGAEEVADGTYPFLAKVSFGEARSCTGTLVDARWILTAKSCFAEGTAPVTAGAPTRPTTVLLGRTDLTRVSGHRLLVESVIPHPDRNLALAELSAPVKDVAPVELGGANPQPGEVLRTAGYGRTATEWVPNRLHAASFTVQSVAATSFQIAAASAGATLCKGDAGGPTFRETQGRVELVGVNDASWQKGCLGETDTREGAVEARVDDLADWIRSSVAVQPSGLREPVTGEFNRDGLPDLVGVDAAGTLWLYPGTPTPNTFRSRIWIGGGWGGYRELVVGRVNRDAYDDLVAIENSTGKLWLYPGTASGGTFGTRVQIGGNWTSDFHDLAIGRVNRDGYDDLIAVKTSTTQLLMYAGNATGPTFDAAVQIGAGWGCCKQLTLGKFNNDDYDDLLTVQSSTGKLLIYAGNAAGTTFDAGVDTGAGTAWNGSSYLAAGQFNGSGLDELVAVDSASGQTWIHSRNADGSWAARVQPAGKIWQPQPYELNNLVTGEFTRDGYTDIIGTDSAGVLWLHPGTAANTFGPRIQIGTGWGAYRELVVGRIDRDGYDDLAAIESSTSKLWLYPGTASGGAFGTKVQIGAGWTSDFHDLAIGRVNRDGYDDLITVKTSTTQLLMYAGNATGTTFDAGVQIGAGWGCCKQLTLGKFNGDGYDDLLTVQSSTGKLLSYAGNAAGTTFDAGVDTGAGTGWGNRSELTAVRFGQDTGYGLLSKDTSGALALHTARPDGSTDWTDPVQFGPRD
ncbi:trypsin-like serine protease [Plantactinospora siamensis]|uniref:Trypsin-like serine protease n=1 Tax=Plantactinospora siamensis TaxID=555372 RepID=A0ABV6NVI4_9ACTN